MIPLFAIRQISMEEMAVGNVTVSAARAGRARKNSRGKLVLARN